MRANTKTFSGRDKETPELGKPFAFMVMKKESIAGKWNFFKIWITSFNGLRSFIKFLCNNNVEQS